jgi:putative two-component system response regulator
MTLPDRPTVLVVDDTPANLALAASLLSDRYFVKVANSGEAALKVARQTPAPDLILLDVVMKGLDGYEVCRQLKGDPETRDIPVLFLTSKNDTDDEKLGLDLGAVDYLTKPISPAIFLARIQTHLNVKAASDFLRNQNEFLEQEVDRRTSEVRALQEVTVLAMASLAETRDADTGNHLWRTQLYIQELALRLKDHPRFRHDLAGTAVTSIVKTAPLHDIGKVGIPDRILLKPGRLDADEFAIMKTHAQLGWDALDHAERSLGASVDFLKTAKEIALTHHEKWDGSGYPKGLEGTDIPVAGRLMAVADVYDALISKRVYKDEMTHQQAAALIGEGSGKHFDPYIVEAFFDCEGQLQDIAHRYADA